MLQEPMDEELVVHEVIPEPDQHNEQDAADGAWQAALVARCLAGDEYAFTVITNRYGGLLLRTAYLLVRDEESAKDIVQDALLLSWKHMAKLREPAFLRAWLLKIVVNQSMSLKRQWARKASLLHAQMLQSYVNTTIEAADFQHGSIEDTLDVLQAIERLPVNQRVVLVLFYYQRMTMPEIADMLGVAENTLRKRLQAALEKVRRALNIDLSTTKRTALTADAIDARISIHQGGVR